MSKPFVLSVILTVFYAVIGCQSQEERLPSIDMLEIIPVGSGAASRSRGIVNIELSAAKPTSTFWNDWDTQTDPWGTITLLGVDRNGNARIDLSGFVTEAMPGEVFEGTGFKLLQSNYEDQSAKLWSRWTRTVMQGPSGSARDAGE